VYIPAPALTHTRSGPTHTITRDVSFHLTLGANDQQLRLNKEALLILSPHRRGRAGEIDSRDVTPSSQTTFVTEYSRSFAFRHGFADFVNRHKSHMGLKGCETASDPLLET
jgi:hypothetical protein